MKLTDYLAQYLADSGIKKVFLVTGGACAHIVDSLGKNPDINYVCMQHEQAAAMAADAYSRVTKNIGVAVATSGPGATNLITGVCCSYFDSIPTLMITGQVNLWETKGERKIRQLGFQETDIIDIVRPITKFAEIVRDPNEIKYYLDKAIHIAKSGRPGPVWLDIPMNVQHAEINPEELIGFTPEEDPSDLNRHTPLLSTHTVAVEAMDQIMKAKRPVIIAGAGIKLGKAENEFLKILETLKIPVVSTWSGIDILPHNHPLYIGQFGVYGNRAANFTIQNADLVLSLGSRLDTRQTGGQPKTFAREAYKIVVDIDNHELNKEWVVADLPINADVKDFLASLLLLISKRDENISDFSDWQSICLRWKERYPTVLPEYHQQEGSVNSYVFTRTLSEVLPPNSIIIPDQGGNLTWTIQGFGIKKGHRLFSAFGNSPMGYAMPAAIGAAFADPTANIICIDGDGGFQMNIQDLQTIRHYNLPIKMFILNNNSYGIIKQFQEVYFGGRYEATVEQTGYSAPNFVRVAQAYGIRAETIHDHSGIKEKIIDIINSDEPILCDVKLDESQKLIPKLVAVKTGDGRYISKPIEDMIPLLPRDEFMENMIIEPLEEKTGSKKSSEIN
ncbi:MAG: thiamine pyrophosphate-binding protein [Candidatus Yanofskybacteria bacterium]|nr:thiamine pyrophosphate-binding protein [Candidatus Yanofskybacteria bacterium]